MQGDSPNRPYRMKKNFAEMKGYDDFWNLEI